MALPTLTASQVRKLVDSSVYLFPLYSTSGTRDSATKGIHSSTGPAVRWIQPLLTLTSIRPYTVAHCGILRFCTVSGCVSGKSE